MAQTGLTGRRAENALRCRALRSLGLLEREIAAQTGLSRSYVNALLNDPNGDNDKSRKDRYRGVCESCGARTDGSNGRALAPKLCISCSTAEQHEQRHWTQERIVEALQQVAHQTGVQPAAQEFLYGMHPGFQSVPSMAIREFGTWREAMKAAGFETKVGHKRFGTIRYEGWKKMATYVVLVDTIDGEWQVCDELEATTGPHALKKHLESRGQGDQAGRYVVVPKANWRPKRVKLVMRPTLVTEPDV